MYQRILVPIEGSPTSTRGLDEAIRLAQLTGATLRLLHVLDDLVLATSFETGATYMNDVLPMIRKAGESILMIGKARVAAAGVTVDTLLLECFAKRTSEIVIAQAQAWKADLIVLGTHGRRGIGRLLMGRSSSVGGTRSTRPSRDEPSRACRCRRPSGSTSLRQVSVARCGAE